MPSHVFDQGNPQHVAVAGYLKQRADGDERVAELLWHSVGRIWLKHGERFLTHDFARIGMIAHIADWLKVSVIDNAPWLAKVDCHGRPRKFLKFGTLEAIHAEADKQMRLKQTRQAEIDALSTDDEVMHFDLGEGWRIVRMLSASALDRESSLMQHCIGHGGYDEDLAEDDGTLLLSLRDPRGKPHVTLEIVDGVLEQFQGKQNNVPLGKYIERCLPFLRSAAVECNGMGFLVKDVGGTVYSIYDLPDKLTVKGDLTIHGDKERAVRLPNEIIVDGDVSISCHSDEPGFSSIPCSLHVSGNLTMRGAQIKELPTSFVVGGSITLEDSGISLLPENLSVVGDLSVRWTPLRALPSRLRVGRLLDLRATDVAEIPGDLRCGSIDISRTKVRRFDTAVFLDKEVTGGCRTLVAEEASCLEEIVGDPIFCRLNLRGTKINTLPPGLSVAKDLTIASTPIREISADVRIGGCLDASECDLVIGPTEMGKDVLLSNARVSFPDSFRCGGMLRIFGGQVVRWPRHVHADFFLISGGPGDSLPEHIEAELVDVGVFPDCRLTGKVTAKKLRISGDIAFIGKGVKAADVELRMSGRIYTASVKDVRDHLERHGNLEKPPKNAREIPFGQVGVGSGKTNFMSRLWREMTERKHVEIVYSEPMPFVLDHEMPISPWRFDNLPVANGARFHERG